MASTPLRTIALLGAVVMGFVGYHELARLSVDAESGAIANLDPALLSSYRRAADAAARDGITLEINSGWRSRADQAELFSDAVATYGSEEEAARWVAPPDDSAHVSGDAIDVGGEGATAWLSQRGAGFGLCQIYDNEPWHYELRPEAITGGCPDRYADATQDPRMQR